MREIGFAARLDVLAVMPASAGPGARGEGRVFASLSYEPSVDRDDPFLALTERYSQFSEYGLTQRLTLGLDATDGRTAGDRATFAFLRCSLSAPEDAHQFAISLGLGQRFDTAGSGRITVIGGSQGRGFEAPWSSGRTVADGQLRLRDAGDTVGKLDLTLGLRPAESRLFHGQVQLSDHSCDPLSARLQTSFVQSFGSTLKAEFGLLYGFRNDKTAGIKVGTWIEF